MASSRSGITIASACAAALLLASCVATAPAERTLARAPLVEGGRVQVRVTTDYDGTPGDAQAPAPTGVTLRTELGWESGEWRGLTAQFGYDDLYARAERVAATRDGATTRLDVPALSRLGPAVANLAWSDGATRVALGRQALAPAGERFVGVVGWRPGEQSYDGLQLRRRLGPNTELSYTWATGIGAGEHPDAGAASRWRGRFHLLDGTVAAGRLGNLQGFAYRMAFADAVRTDTAATAGGAQSGATFGAAWRREFRLGEYAPLPVAVSYATATRQDMRRAPYAVRYLQVEASLGTARLKVGRGTVDHDPRTAPESLRSPLPTWYAAEGWGGRFQTAGSPGAVDTYALLQADVSGTALELGRHAVRAGTPALGVGTEWNTTLSRRLAQWLHVQARFASLRGALGEDRHYWLHVSAPIR